MRALEFKIEISDFSTILPIWRNRLWPERESKIEPTSWIRSDGEIDTTMTLGKPTFWIALNELEEIIGVCSGYRTSSESYRSRGLWVSSDFRGQGVAKGLMRHVESQAVSEGCAHLWTMPRSSAWPFYKSVGFEKTNETDRYEYGPHVLAAKNISLKFI